MVRLVSVRFEKQKVTPLQQEFLVLVDGCSWHIQKSGSQGCMQLATLQTIEGADQILNKADADHAKLDVLKGENTKKYSRKQTCNLFKLTTTHKYRE